MKHMSLRAIFRAKQHSCIENSIFYAKKKSNPLIELDFFVLNFYLKLNVVMLHIHYESVGTITFHSSASAIYMCNILIEPSDFICKITFSFSPQYCRWNI